jgi:hypothetical protein
VKRGIAVVLAVFLGLALVTVYRNVLADDLAVRSLAENTARAKATCGEKCVLLHMEGSRGAFSESLEFQFRGREPVAVTCKRPYITFGDYACTAQ